MYIFWVFCVKKNGFYIFRIFKMLARFYKYDFWTPDKILSWNRKNLEKKIFFQIEKNLEENIFFKSGKISRFFGKIEKIRKFYIVFSMQNFRILIIFKKNKKCTRFEKNIFFEIFFRFEKIFSFLNFFYSNSKFCQDSKNHT